MIKKTKSATNFYSIISTFGFLNTENLDFGSIGATLNHILQQGISDCVLDYHIFLNDFTTYSRDKHKFDQEFKFYTKWGFSEKYACDTQMITIHDILSYWKTLYQAEGCQIDDQRSCFGVSNIVSYFIYLNSKKNN